MGGVWACCTMLAMSSFVCVRQSDQLSDNNKMGNTEGLMGGVWACCRILAISSFACVRQSDQTIDSDNA